MLTPMFAKVKGQTEQELFDMHKANPNFRPYNVRPGGVDWRDHPEIHPFMTPQTMIKSGLTHLIGPMVKGIMSPTRELGKVLTELAMSQGEPLHGKDIQMEGRLVPNSAFRRMAGL
jgi:hypothetical protein